MKLLKSFPENIQIKETAGYVLIYFNIHLMSKSNFLICTILHKIHINCYVILTPTVIRKNFPKKRLES